MSGMADWQAKISIDIEDLKKRIKVAEGELDKVTKEDRKIKLDFDTKTLESAIQKLDKMLDSLGKGTSDFKQFENLSKELSNIVSEVQSLSKAFGKVDDSGAKTLLSSIQNIDRSLSELSQHILNVNKNMSNMGSNTGGAVKQVENISNAYQDAAKEAEKLADAQSKIGQKTNISSASTPAIEQQNKLQEELKETQQQAEKARQSISKLVESRDIVSQNWYREKGTVVSKDLKGNDITRDADEFSFVERLKNGQLQTVLATYNEETGKWAEQIINVRTAFEQVERAIISADNKIASLEMAKDKTLAAHPGYDATADDNQIALERKKRDELQATLNLYGSEKEYVFEIEAATKRIADNQERLNNKKQSQTNLRQAVSDEKDTKANEQANKRDAKQAQIEAENIKLAEQKTIYNELNDSLDRYLTVSKRIENGKALEGDYEEAAKLQEKIEELQNNPILSQEQLDASQRKLDKIETTLEDIATAKAKSDSVKVDSENVKNIQAEWGKNIKAIQDYMDAVTKLNNLKAKDKGTGSEANQIELQTQNVEKLKQVAFEARQNLSSMQAENPDIITWKQWVDMMELFDQASKGSAESAAKLKDVLDNIKVPSLDKYENKLASYQTKTGGYNATIARFKDGGWTSDEYLKNVQAVENAVKKYEDLLSNIKAKGSIASEEDVQKLDKYEKKIKETIATVTNMSAAEKGYNFVSAQKELDKIHKLLNENSKMSSEAKNKIKAYYREIESGNPSMSLDKIHGEIMKIYNAEVEAGRAGRTLWDTLKNSGFHQIAAQMAGMFGVYDIINVVRQGINTVRELDTAMTEVRKVSNATETQYASFRDTISSTAKEIATTNKELLNSSADFLRLGYSLDQASDLAKNATLFVNVGDGVDITEATEDMITAMKAFDIQAEDSIKIVDDYNQIGNQFALSASDIGEAMKRSASALETGNNSFEQSIGLITAMNEIVQNSENTGNSLKVLSLRLRGAKAELEDMQEDTDGLCDSTSKLREQIKSLTGVDIMLDDNTFKSTTDIIKELGAVWDKLSDSSQAATLELIAGKSRANNVAALLKNYQRIDEVMESLGDAEGSAMRENEAIVDSIDGRIKKLSASMEDFWQKAINTDFVKNIVSSLDTILNLLTKIIDQFGLLPTIIGVGGAGTGIFKFIKNFDWVFKPYIKLSNSF